MLLSASSHIRDISDGRYNAVIDIKPALSSVSYTHLDVYKRQLKKRYRIIIASTAPIRRFCKTLFIIMSM